MLIAVGPLSCVIVPPDVHAVKPVVSNGILKSLSVYNFNVLEVIDST